MDYSTPEIIRMFLLYIMIALCLLKKKCFESDYFIVVIKVADCDNIT